MPSADKQSRIPILVISDGKPGHENQSLGIAERIPDADILLVRHSIKESFFEAVFRCRIRFSWYAATNPRGLLESIFTDEKIDRILNHAPKLIIAAGTLSAGPCILAGKLTGAKTCICMRPSFLPLSMYDLAVVPKHDNTPDGANILKTIAAPNRVSRNLLRNESETWKKELPEGNKVISWIIGGPSSSAKFDSDHVLEALIKNLEWTRQNPGWQVWLSTARRTPETLEEEIENLAEDHKSLTWKLLWHRDQRNPLYAMFYRSRLSIVTSDSVSMIAESASSGKGTVVFHGSCTKCERKSKQLRMVDNLIEAGYVASAENSDGLIEVIRHIISTEKKFPMLDDTDKAAQRLLELIQ